MVQLQSPKIEIKSKTCFGIVSQTYFDIPLQALQSLLGIYFPIASFLWTDAIAIHIYMLVSDVHCQPKQRDLYHAQTRDLYRKHATAQKLNVFL